MTAERRLENQSQKFPDWGLFQQSLSPETPLEIVDLLHKYYQARVKVIEGDMDAAKKIYQTINDELLEGLEKDESGDINFIGVILTGQNVFDAPNDPVYFEKARIAAILPQSSNPSSN